MKTTSPQCENCLCRKDSLLNHCVLEELERINSNKSCNIYKKGQFIFHEGNKPFGVFCVNEGKIKISKTDSNGKEQIVRLAKPGDTLGYRALMANSKYTASAVALEDSKVCFISEQDFTQLIKNNEKVANDLLVLLSKALGEAEEKLKKLALKPVRERLAEGLLLLLKTYHDGSDKPFTISISREDLSGIVGTAKETVIRFLSEFKEEGIVDTKGSAITILRKDKLLEISQLYD
jgi:CRP-like cAMP-binding protein